MRTCTSTAPASRNIRTSARWVLPRTIESSTTIEPLAADHLFERIELEPDTQLADGLRRLDEGASDVGVLGQALPVGDARLLRVADGSRDTGLRNADDQVGIHRPLLGQPAADVDARPVHRTAADRAVGPGQVDVLEDAALRRRRGEPARPHAVGVDGQQLARFDVADERGADDVEGGGLRRDHPAAIEAPQRQRPHPVRVAGRVEGVLVHERQAERPAHGRQQLECGLLQ